MKNIKLVLFKQWFRRDTYSAMFLRMNLEDKIFYCAIATSILIHLNLIVILSLPILRKLKKPIKQIEVTYFKIKDKGSPGADKKRSEVKSINDKKLFPKVDVLSHKQEKTPMFKQTAGIPPKLKMMRRTPNKMTIMTPKGKVSVPVLTSEKITNPKYLWYTQKVREIIKKRAYAFVDHPEFAPAEVYLSFVLLASGKLKEAKLNESKSNASSFMRMVGLRSIKEAKQFPPFPKDLAYPELPFHVIISFEIEEE